VVIDVEGEEGSESFKFTGLTREALPDTPEDLTEESPKA